MADTYAIMVRPVGDQTAEDLIADASAIMGQQFTLTGYHDGEYEIKAPGDLVILDINLWLRRTTISHTV